MPEISNVGRIYLWLIIVLVDRICSCILREFHASGVEKWWPLESDKIVLDQHFVVLAFCPKGSFPSISCLSLHCSHTEYSPRHYHYMMFLSKY